MSKGYTITEGFYDSPVMLGAYRTKLERSDTMPIDGLTDINRPPRQGMLRLGIKKTTSSGKEYPAEVDYFILDPETPDEAVKKRLIDKFHEVFGNNPKAIEVKLLSSDINKAFPQNYKRYGRNTSLKCIGDGQTAVCTEQDYSKGLKSIGFDERGFTKVECHGRGCGFATTNDAATTKECKATATLSVKIPQLGGFGVWQLTTGSFNSIVNINSGIRDLISTYGQAHNIPIILERRPQETSYKGKKTTHYTLHINEAPKTAEAARAIEATPEIDPTEAPPEILDADIDHEATPDKLADTLPEKTKEDLEEYDKTTKKILDKFSGEKVEEQKLPEVIAEEDKKFLDGLKEDAKSELGVEGGKPIKSRAIDKAEAEKTKIIFPSPFGKFMAFCKHQLEEAGKGDMYKDAFHLYSVKTAADLENDQKKQIDMRKYLISLVEDEGNVSM